MFLSDVDIKAEVERGNITIKDFDESRLQPASYDILLGNRFIVTDPHGTEFFDPSRGIEPKTQEINVEDDGKFVLHPGVNALGVSWDYFGSDKYLIQLSGKSSLARIGLIVHNTAGIINPGHYLNVTLELHNLNSVPIVLRPKMSIAQLLFSKLSSPTRQSYKQTGRYNHNNWQSWAPEKNNGDK